MKHASVGGGPAISRRGANSEAPLVEQPPSSAANTSDQSGKNISKKQRCVTI